MTKEEAIRILYEMLSKTFNGGGELGGLAVQMAVEALRKQEMPVSEDLEEAAIMHYKDVMEYEAKTGLKPAYMTSFKAGAQWQKEHRNGK